jgi:3-hydroxyisobutyrate dehydrogenase-like beta-hydroxyacid dehydrogenase
MAQMAFLGLGRMGRAMAGRLLAAGYSLTVYNRTAEKAEPLRRQSAAVAATPHAMSADDHWAVAPGGQCVEAASCHNEP